MSRFLENFNLPVIHALHVDEYSTTIHKKGLQTGGRSRIFKRGSPTSTKGAISRGVWRHAPPEIFENLSLLNGHFQHFETNFVLIYNTNFLLVNFTFVKKKSKKGEGRSPPRLSLGSATDKCLKMKVADSIHDDSHSLFKHICILLCLKSRQRFQVSSFWTQYQELQPCRQNFQPISKFSTCNKVKF